MAALKKTILIIKSRKKLRRNYKEQCHGNPDVPRCVSKHEVNFIL